METIFNSLSQFSHLFLYMAVNGLIFGLLFSAAFWFFRKYTKTTSSNNRYYLWWSALLIIVIIPAFFVVSLTVDFSSLLPSSTPDTTATMVSQKSNSPTTLPAIQNNRQLAPPPPPSPAVRTLPAPLTVQPVAVAQQKQVSFATLLKLLPIAFFLIWAVVSIKMLMQVRSAYRKVKQLKRSVNPLDLRYYPNIQRYINQWGCKRKIIVGTSDDVTVPMAAGFSKPMVLLPTRLLNQITPGELEIIVIHELVHLKRYDDWTKLGQRVIEAFNFFQPVVFWIGRQLDLEREIACDDEVVAYVGSSEKYADCLTKMLQLTCGTGTTLIPGVFSNRQQLFKRFEILLMKNRPRRQWTGIRTMITAAGLLIVAAVIFAVSPVVAVPGSYLSYNDIQSHISELLTDDDTEKQEQPETPKIDYATWKENANSYVAVQADEAPEDIEIDIEPESYIKYDEQTDAFSFEYKMHELEAKFREAEIAVNNAFAVAWATPEGRDDDDEGFLDHLADWVDEVVTPSHGSLHISDDNGRTTASWSTDNHFVKMKMRGQVEFSDDARMITSISKRGYFKLYEKKRGTKREIEITQDNDGTLEFYYEVDGDEAEFDDDAREWLGDLLTETIYRTGMGADKRVAQLYDKGGVDAVLDDMDNIESDYVARLFLTYLLQIDDLQSDEVARVLQFVRLEIDSDYEKAEMLLDVAHFVNSDNKLVSDYVDVVETIDSDYETRRVLSGLILDNRTNPEVVKQILTIAERNIDSNYEKAELMIEIAPLCHNNPELGEAYVQALRTIDSDYECRRVFTMLSDETDLNDNSIEELLLLASEMDSDYEKAEFFIDLSRMIEDNEALQLRMVQELSTLDSDYEKRRVLEEFHFVCPEDLEQIKAMIKVARMFSSDYDRRQSIRELSECAAKEAEVRTMYLELLYEFSSDYEKKELCMDLIRELDDDRDAVLAILKSLYSFNSDYEKSEVLKRLAKDCRGDDELEDAYLDVVETISSDYTVKELYYKLHGRRSKSSAGI